MVALLVALSGCSDRGENVARNGEITTLSFATEFILDVEQLSAEYFSAHPGAVQHAAAFSGRYGRTDVSFPGAGSTTADAVNVSGRIMITQETVDERLNRVSPTIVMAFPQGAIAPGPVALGAGPSKIFVEVVRVSAFGVVECVDAIAVGQATVTVASGTDAAAGGALAIEGSRIPLYHPTATPDGDLSALVEAEGAPICP